MSIYKNGLGYNDQRTIRVHCENGEAGVSYRVTGDLLLVHSAVRDYPYGSNTVGVRGVIDKLSDASARRMRKYLRESTSEYSGFITLTYGRDHPTDGQVAKDHLRRFLQELHRYQSKFRRADDVVPYSSFWFLEFQARGAPHYHIYTTHFVPKSWLSLAWARIIQSDENRKNLASSTLELAKTCTNVKTLTGPRWCRNAYVMKYAAKSKQKAVPAGFENVGRFWGVSGCRQTASAECFAGPRENQVKSLRLALEAIRAEIKRGIALGSIELVIKKQGFRMLSIKSEPLKIRLSSMINNFTVSSWENHIQENELLESLREEQQWCRKTHSGVMENLATLRHAIVQEWPGMSSQTRELVRNQYSPAQLKAWGLQGSDFSGVTCQADWTEKSSYPICGTWQMPH